MFDYWKWDSAVPDWFCNNIINNTDWNVSEKASVAKKESYEIDENIRISNIFWAVNDSPIGCIAQTYIRIANVSANWNFDLTSCEKIQIGKYEQNGKYDWHIDTKYNEKLVRKLSILILLNDEFEGGAFEFKKPGLNVTLKKGSILVFPSYLEHRVAPVISGTRYSAVTWFNGPHFK